MKRSSSAGDVGNLGVSDDVRLERALRAVALASARGELSEAGLADLVASRIRGLLASVTAAVIRLDAEWLTVVGYAGPTPYPVSLAKDEPSSSREAVMSGRVARVERYGPPDGPVAAFIAAQGLTCGISVPVRIDERVWGCITVTTGCAGGFRVDEERWLERFAELISAALANAVAKEELRVRVRLEEALREPSAPPTSRRSPTYEEISQRAYFIRSRRRRDGRRTRPLMTQPGSDSDRIERPITGGRRTKR